MTVRRVLLVSLAVSAAVAAPLPASAQGGGSSTPLVPGPCVDLVVTNSGLELHGGTSELDLEARSCSSSNQVLSTVVTDAATRVLYPGWDCGTASYAGPSLTLRAGRTTKVSLALRHGTCAPASAEQHDLTIDARTSTGQAVATTYASWSDAPATASR